MRITDKGKVSQGNVSCGPNSHTPDHDEQHQKFIWWTNSSRTRGKTASRLYHWKKKEKKGFARNLLETLEIYKDGVLRFIKNNLVPFDNNLAERDIRMMKVKMKISGGSRDKETAQTVALIKSYISTIRKNGERVIEAINAAFNYNPWSPHTHIIAFL